MACKEIRLCFLTPQVTGEWPATAGNIMIWQTHAAHEAHKENKNNRETGPYLAGWCIVATRLVAKMPQKPFGWWTVVTDF